MTKEQYDSADYTEVSREFFRIYRVQISRSEHWKHLQKHIRDIDNYTYTSKFLDDMKYSSFNKDEYLEELRQYADWINKVITKDLKKMYPWEVFFKDKDPDDRREYKPISEKFEFKFINP